MKEKIIKSKQVVCETPAIMCDCGGSCFGIESGDTYNLEDERGYNCEECGQIWVLPEGVDIVAIFRKIRRPSK